MTEWLRGRRKEHGGVPDPAAHPGPGRHGPGRRADASGRDFWALLRRAEDLRNALVRDRRRRLGLRAVQALAGSACVLALFAAAATTGLPAPVLAVLALAGPAVAVLVEVCALRPAAERRARRLAELTDLVDELREVLVHLAKKERWPAHRVRDARDRLARFSVEERGGLW